MSVLHLTRRILAALWMCAAGTPAAAHAADLAVRVNFTFDRSIPSKDIRAAAQDEAAAIWRAYGVDLLWTDTGRPDLCLDAIVERHHRHVNLDRLMVLGRTTIEPGETAHAFIRISFDAVDAVVEQQPIADLPVHDQAFAFALGRVLAHEVGHVLLGVPGYHDPEGLMRARIPSSDLVRMARLRFQLTAHSVARLRARIASLSDARPSGSCTKPDEADQPGMESKGEQHERDDTRT